MGNDLDRLGKPLRRLRVSLTLTSSEENLCFMVSCAAAELVGSWRGLVGNDGVQTPMGPVARVGLKWSLVIM
jgi:hypothetical protein